VVPETLRRAQGVAEDEVVVVSAVEEEAGWLDMAAEAAAAWWSLNWPYNDKMCGGAVLLTSSEVTDRPVDSLNDFCQVLMARLMEGTSICGRFKEACLRAIWTNSVEIGGVKSEEVEDPKW
jgi:hypothetical protein